MVTGKKPIFTIMLIPLVVVVAIIFIYPLFRVLYLSFFDYHPVFGKEFVGLQTYRELMVDKLFLTTILRTFTYVIVVVLSNLVIGMVYSLLTYRSRKGVKVLRLILIVPILLIPAVTASSWMLLYNGQFGLINHILGALGLPAIMWLSSSRTAFPAVMVTDIWGWIPFVYLILLAGMQSIPTEPFEAAELDGASSTQKFIYLMLPMMKPVIATAMIIKTLDTYKTFTFVWIMTKGGPGHSSQVLGTLIFNKAFSSFQYGLGSTMSIIMLLIGFLLIFLIFLIFRERNRW